MDNKKVMYSENKKIEYLDSVIEELEELKKSVINGEVKLDVVRKELSAYVGELNSCLEVRIDFH